LRFTKSVIMFV